MEYDMFFDLKRLAKNISLNMTKVKITTVCALKVKKTHPNSLFYKVSYSSDDWQKAVVIKKPMGNLNLIPAYPTKPGLDKATKDALIKLFDKRAIPNKFRGILRVPLNRTNQTNDNIEL